MGRKRISEDGRLLSAAERKRRYDTTQRHGTMLEGEPLPLRSLQLYLTESERERLEEIAKIQGLKRNQLIGHLLAGYRTDTYLTPAARAGLAKVAEEESLSPDQVIGHLLKVREQGGDGLDADFAETSIFDKPGDLLWWHLVSDLRDLLCPQRSIDLQLLGSLARRIGNLAADIRAQTDQGAAGR